MSSTAKNHHRKVKHKKAKTNMRKSGYDGVDLRLNMGNSTLQTPEEHRQDSKTDQVKDDKTEVNF